MKKYTFRLEPVLKLRKLKEENCKAELGQLITHMNKLNEQLEHDRKEISNYYAIQENALKNGIKGNQIQTFPMLVAAKENNIQLLNRDKNRQQRLIDEKLKELAALKGEVKTITSLKEKDFETWKKTYNKELDQKIEEQTQNWMQFKQAEDE